LTETAERVALELRHQYFIGFTPANAQGAGKWSRVRIKVTSPSKKVKNLYVHSRGGYFASSP
jgi:hypothetical protein